ncbi:MAG: alkaline shock response membrane anchor protein AmaP [Dehalococcoidia bacterium]|nr:alkaline shock response membrane anchor protein AmaP [Dehalococcoidia bacterium]
MNTFNRIVVIILALVFLAAAIITLLVTFEVLAPDFLPAGWFESQLESAAGATGGLLAAIIAAAVVLALLMLALLLREFMPSGERRREMMVVGSTEEGEVAVDQQSVRMLAEKSAASSRNVRDVTCDVNETRGGLIVSCNAALAPGTNMQEFSDEAKGRIKEAVEQGTGMEVVKVNLRSRYESGGGRRSPEHR